MDTNSPNPNPNTPEQEPAPVVNNMYTTKGPLSRAVNSMFHDTNTGFAAQQNALAKLNNRLSALYHNPTETVEDTKAIAYDLYQLVQDAKAEKQVIMDAMDGFYKEYQKGFPDRFKKEE